MHMNMTEAITALLNSTQLLKELSNEFIDIETENEKDYEAIINGSYQRKHIIVSDPNQNIKFAIVSDYKQGKLGLAHFDNKRSGLKPKKEDD